MELFKKWVTCFDRRVVARLFALEAFLGGQGNSKSSAKPKPFLGFTDEQSLAVAMSISMPEDWDVFRQRVGQVAAHVRSVGERAYFTE